MRTTRILTLIIPLLVVANARSQTALVDSSQAQFAASSTHTNTLWEDLQGKVYIGFDVGVALQHDLKIKQISGLDLPIMVAPGTTLDKATYEFDPGIRVDLNARYRLTDSLSLGLEAGFIYNNINKIEVTETSLGTTSTAEFGASDSRIYQVPILADMVYRFPTHGRLKPYVGAGLGGVVTILELPSSTQNDFTFAYQGMAGISVEIDPQWDMGLGYEFLGTLDHTLGDLKTDPMYTHCVFISWTYKY